MKNSHCVKKHLIINEIHNYIMESKILNLDLKNLLPVKNKRRRARYAFKVKGGRPGLIDITSTNTDIGPGKYDDVRTSFPILKKEIDPLLNKPARQTHNFCSKSPRLSPPLLPPSPIPGTYRNMYNTIGDNVGDWKKIGKNGMFFTKFPKFYYPPKDVYLL